MKKLVLTTFALFAATFAFAASDQEVAVDTEASVELNKSSKSYGCDCPCSKGKKN